MEPYTEKLCESSLPSPAPDIADTKLPAEPSPSPVQDPAPPRACRICLAEDEGFDEFISPCQCKGTIKYVHVTCLKSWRQALLDTGRDREVDGCTLCRRRFRLKRSWVAEVLEYRAMRVVVTVGILLFLLIPSGYLMKLCIHLSIFFTNNLLPRLLPLLFSSPLRALSTPDTATHSTSYPLYAPFPVCTTTSSLPPTADHDLVHHRWLYWLLFPFADARCWHLLLCRCQHLHLGFFFLGSVNNVWTTHAMLSEMYDILADDLGIAPQPGVAQGGNGNRRAGAYRRRIKTFLLLYSCLLIILFWVHYNLLAFRTWGGSTSPLRVNEDSSELPTQTSAWPPRVLPNPATLGTPQAVAVVTSEDFMLELPLWALRWVTLGVAVCDFGIRRVYRWVKRWGRRVEVDVVVSVEEGDSGEGMGMTNASTVERERVGAWMGWWEEVVGRV